MRIGKAFPLFRDNTIGAGAGFNNTMPRRRWMKSTGLFWAGIPFFSDWVLSEEGAWHDSPAGVLWRFPDVDTPSGLFTFSTAMVFNTTSTRWASWLFTAIGPSFDSARWQYELGNFPTGWQYPPIFSVWFPSTTFTTGAWTISGALLDRPALFGDLPPPWPQ